MHPAPILQPATVGAATAAVPGRRVIDAPTRMFHWLFALGFAAAYATADAEPWRALHVTLGYTVAGLLVFRVLYGVFGPRQARLAPMLRKLAGVPAWLRSVRCALGRGGGGVNWRQGQNLLMTLAVAGLFVLVPPLTLSGYAAYSDWGDLLGGDWLEELHEFFGEAMLAVVMSHLSVILGLSLWRRSNQALPMLTGRIQGNGPDLARHDHRWLAALLLLAVLAFAAWQWQQSPDGLLPGQTPSGIGLDGHRRHDRDHDD